MQTLSTGRRRNGERFRRSHQAGLTLIELMVVMAIMVLLASVTAPTMVAAHREARIRSAARLVLSGLSYARSRAVSSGTTTRFNVRQPRTTGPAPPTVWVSVLEQEPDSATTRFKEESTPSGRVRALPEGVALEVAKEASDQSAYTEPVGDEEEGVSYLTFWRNGQTVNALLTLTVDRSRRRYIRLEALTGRARLVDEENLTAEELELGNETQ